jgi:quercetin dioxygenase-like cupin family protein
MIHVSAVIALLLATSAPAAAPPVHLGAAFTLREATPIDQIERDPARWFNRDVRVEGVVASCCTQEGCFVEVVPESGGGEGIVVNFPDSTRFPVDCAGARVVIEGTFYRKVYPASRVAHWQGHSFRHGREVPDYSMIQRITAKGAEFLPGRVAAPAPGTIVAGATDRVDLATAEFETDGFGTGRKILAPGERTPAHGTGNVREMIFCLEGEVTVRRGDAAPVTLGPGEMSFLPPRTQHEVWNAGRHPATYLFVFSRAPEPAAQEHAH